MVDGREPGEPRTERRERINTINWLSNSQQRFIPRIYTDLTRPGKINSRPKPFPNRQDLELL